MPPAAQLTDTHTWPAATGSTKSQCSPNVIIDGAPDVIANGPATAFMNGLPAMELQHEKVVILNVEPENSPDDGHYVYVKGRQINQGHWEVLIVDPSVENLYWAKMYSTVTRAKKRIISKINSPGGGKYTIKVAYYLKSGKPMELSELFESVDSEQGILCSI